MTPANSISAQEPEFGGVSGMAVMEVTMQPLR
jgi:hypothetical protein